MSDLKFYLVCITFSGLRKLSSMENSLIECDSWDFVNKGQCFDLFIFDHQTGASTQCRDVSNEGKSTPAPSLFRYTWMSRPPHPWIRECSIKLCLWLGGWGCCWRVQEG